MKKVFIILFVLLTMQLHARNVSSLMDLRLSDTFSMKISLSSDDPNQNRLWELSSMKTIDIDFEVTSASKDVVELAIKPTRWFIYDDRSKDATVFFDTSYIVYFDLKKFAYLFDNNSVRASINLNDGNLSLAYTPLAEEQASNSTRKEWYTQLYEIPKGLKISYFENKFPDLVLNFEKVIESSLSGFVNEWRVKSKEGLPMPCFIDFSLDKKNKISKNKPVFLQITAASFDLQSNVEVAFAAPKGMPDDRVFIENGTERILPTSRTGNTYKFAFYLSSPQRMTLGDAILDLTPGDSLSVQLNATTNKYDYKGKGAGNSAFTNVAAIFYDKEKVALTQYSDYDELRKALSKSEDVWTKILSDYSDKMNDYWLRSAKLSFDYWYASESFKQHNNNVTQNWGKNFVSDDKIDWNNEHLLSLFPLADYLYQPYTYGDFVDEFCTYKAGQANNSVMTGMKFFLEKITQYYFVDALFWGYPRSYLTGESLKQLMKRLHLNESREQYEDFLKKNQDPQIRKSIIKLHDQLTKVEPGANLKDWDLDIEKYIPLRNKSENYTILLISDSLDNNQEDPFFEKRMSSFHKEIEKAGFNDKVQVCIITGESRKSYFDAKPQMKNEIVFVPDKMLRDYHDAIPLQDSPYILLRGDGTIINRAGYPSKHMGYPYMLIEFDIKNDIIRQKGNQDSALGRVLVVVLIIIASSSITFLVVRSAIRRRERIKQQILELELKAIRAQINPHFTFNALGSIQNLIAQKKDKEANDYLVNFAKLLRMVLSTSEKKLIPLSEEIELLDLYLKLEQLRMPFDYEILVGAEIESANEEVPGMLLQPLVENAVKHGITPKGGGHISLSFAMKNQRLFVEIADSGNGCDLTNLSESGFGISSVRDRLSLINKELNLDIDLKMENIIKDEQVEGFKVSLSIPV